MATAAGTRGGRIDAVDGYRHEALLYAGDGEFVAGVSRFVRAGVEAEEPVLVVVAAPKIDLLREELGADAAHVEFADMARVGHNPARIIPAWQDFVTGNARPGTRVRGVGEPISPARDPEALVECQRHERLLNLAFAGTSGFWLLCPYDTSALPGDVVEEARRSHPHVVTGAHAHASHDFDHGAAATALLDAPLGDAPAAADELRFDASTLDLVRRTVAERAAEAGLGMRRRIHLVAAAAAVADDSVESGGGGGVLRLWSRPDRVVCELRDRRRLDHALADRQLSPSREDAPVGLLVANQLCDLVQVRRVPGGTVARLHVLRG